MALPLSLISFSEASIPLEASIILHSISQAEFSAPRSLPAVAALPEPSNSPVFSPQPQSGGHFRFTSHGPRRGSEDGILIAAPQYRLSDSWTYHQQAGFYSLMDGTNASLSAFHRNGSLSPNSSALDLKVPDALNLNRPGLSRYVSWDPFQSKNWLQQTLNGQSPYSPPLALGNAPLPSNSNSGSAEVSDFDEEASSDDEPEDGDYQEVAVPVAQQAGGRGKKRASNGNKAQPRAAPVASSSRGTKRRRESDIIAAPPMTGEFTFANAFDLDPSLQAPLALDFEEHEVPILDNHDHAYKSEPEQEEDDDDEDGAPVSKRARTQNTAGKKFWCKCGKGFTRENALRKHQELKHQGVVPASCLLCDKECASKYSGERHIRSRHRENLGKGASLRTNSTLRGDSIWIVFASGQSQKVEHDDEAA